MKTTFIRFAKTMAIASFMFVAFSMSAFAKPVDVSTYLVKQFEQQFRGASGVNWKVTQNFTSATFRQDGQKTEVFYNLQNELIGVSKEITVDQLPKKVQQVLKAHYSDCTIMSVINFADAEGTENYYIQLDNKNNKQILQADEFGSVSNFQK